MVSAVTLSEGFRGFPGRKNCAIFSEGSFREFQASENLSYLVGHGVGADCCLITSANRRKQLLPHNSAITGGGSWQRRRIAADRRFPKVQILAKDLGLAGFGGLAGANRNTPYNNLGRAGLAGLAGYSAADALQQKQVKLDQAAAISALRQALGLLPE